MDRFRKNVSWVLAGNIAHAVLQFALNTCAARFFGADQYGLLNAAAAMIAFFSAVGSLGIQGTITKHFADSPEEASQYLGTGIVARLVLALIEIAGIQCFVRIAAPGQKSLHTLVFFQTLTILFSCSDLLIHWYRFCNRAKFVAVFRMGAFFLAAIGKVWAMFGARSIEMYALASGLEILFYCGGLLIYYLWENGTARFCFKWRLLKKMLLLSYPFIFSALLSTIYGQTDKIMLNQLLNSEAVGFYSVALTLAGAISIIPAALIEGFRPDIMSCKAAGTDLYRRRLQQLYGMVFWICIAYCLCIQAGAEILVRLLYGTEYLKAVTALKLVVWYDAFSYFGAINNLYMIAEKKTGWVQVSTLTGAVLNITLNWIMIPKYGIVGAAVASLITQIVVNFALLYFIRPLRENFYTIVEGITLRGFRH